MDWTTRLQELMASPRSGFVLLLLVAVSYFGVVGAGFVWDDGALVLLNEQTRSFAHIGAVFGGDLWEGVDEASGYYRPLMMLSLMVDYQLWGHDTVGHHLHSLAWHLAATAAVFVLLRRELGVSWAWPIGAVFGLHVAQSEAVFWVSARNDSMSVALGMVALHWAMKPELRGRGLVFAYLFTLLAGLTKESVVLLPACMWVLSRAGGGGRRPLRAYVPVLAAIASLVCIRVVLGVSSVSLGSGLGWSLLVSKAHLMLGLIGQLLWIPAPLSSGYALEWVDLLPSWRTGFGLVILIVWVIGCFRLKGEAGRIARWGVCWFGVCLLPVLPAIAARGLFGERYLYLPMIGFGMSLVAILHRRIVLLLPFLLAWILAIYARAPDWQDDVSLWSASVETHPTPYSYAGLGHALRSNGQPEEALDYFRRAIDAPIPNLEVCPQLVGTSIFLGKHREALILGETAEQEHGCGSGPYAASFHTHMARAAALNLQVERAVFRLGRVQELEPVEGLCIAVLREFTQRIDPRMLAPLTSDFVDTGCLSGSDGPDFGAELAANLAVTGNWQGALELLERVPPDEGGLAWVIRGAWALTSEDPSRYDEVRSMTSHSEVFDEMVQRLLGDAATFGDSEN